MSAHFIRVEHQVSSPGIGTADTGIRYQCIPKHKPGYLWVFVCGRGRGVAGGAGLLGLGGVQGRFPPVPRAPPVALPLPLGVFGSAAAAVSPLLVQLNLAKGGTGTVTPGRRWFESIS